LPEHLFKDLVPSSDPINFIRHQSVSEFPFSTRDFSFSIKDQTKYQKVIIYLSSLNDENLKDSFIFDFYENKKSNEIKVGVRLVFQSDRGTLSEEEVQNSVNRLLKPIIQLEGISIPGLK
jgi:phenylalanyl-tRNA synthetase beta subunit